MPEISIILPVWNEADFIEEVVDGIKHTLDSAKVDYELILVENGSTDKSMEVVEKLCRQNEHITMEVMLKGYGSAVLGGLRTANGKYVCYMPSDGQIDPKIILSLLHDIKTADVDMVKIKRIRRDNQVRSFISLIFNLVAYLLFRVKCPDINGSPKLFSRHYIDLFDIKSKNNLIDTELMVKAKILKFRVKDIPVEELPRAGGESHVNILAIFNFIVGLLKLFFSSDLRKFKIMHARDYQKQDKTSRE